MRITGGRLRGRRLLSPKGRCIRPTSERVREALFSILGQGLEEQRVLDLFAGSGLLGIEAASRGAAAVVWVDRSAASGGIVEKNLRICGLEGCGRFLQWDLSRGLPTQQLMPWGLFDLVFLDPPYAHEHLPETLQALGESALLSPGARLVVETARRSELPPKLHGLNATDIRYYGDTKITIYEYLHEAEHE